MACFKEIIFIRIYVMEEIFETRSSIEILVNDIKIETINQYMFYVVQLMKNYATYCHIKKLVLG